MQAWVYYRRHKLKEETFEALRVLRIFAELGAGDDVNPCENLLQLIKEAKSQDTPGVPVSL